MRIDTVLPELAREENIFGGLTAVRFEINKWIRCRSQKANGSRKIIIFIKYYFNLI